MNKYKTDIFLIFTLLFFLIFFAILYFSFQNRKNLFVNIYYDKVQQHSIDIRKNGKYEVNGVEIIIENQSVYVFFSPCKDKICMSQNKISSAGQTITCLPQHVYIKIEGKEVDVGV